MDQLTARETGEVVLSDEVRGFVKKSKAANTQRIYKIFWQEFEAFTDGRGVECLPASPATIAEFIVALATCDTPNKPSTIGVKLSGLSFAHRAANLPDPTRAELVRATLAGVKAELGAPPRKVEPLELGDIRTMLAELDDSLKAKRDKALVLLGFAGAFRRSELAALDVADLRANGELKITLRRSKTDQEGKGLQKTIPPISDKTVCPVEALRAWLDVAGIASGPVFRKIDRHGNLKAERMTGGAVGKVVKRLAEKAGLDWRAIGGHSLRSGFVTAAIKAGVPGLDIREQTHHGSDQMLHEYYRATGQGASRAVRGAFGEVEDG